MDVIGVSFRDEFVGLKVLVHVRIEFVLKLEDLITKVATVDRNAHHFRK